MKVYIGPYKDWIGPYQLVDMLFFWQSRWPANTERWDYKLNDKMGRWLASTWVNDFCLWIDENRSRNVSIHIDKYDTWSMNHTLGLIALPMLKQLKETKHGAPFTNDEDVPDHLKSINAPPKENDWDTDDFHFDRWDWIMGEMIWAFEQELNDDADNEFYDLINFTLIDKEGHAAWASRKQNGFRLFGRYYQNLWD
jgi:hypothetical protein